MSVVGGDLRQQLRDGLIEGYSGAGMGAAEQSFELGLGFFNWFQVWQVRWQVQQFGTGSLDALTHPVGLVRAKVIHHHYIAWSQGRARTAIQVGEENVGVGGFLDDHGRDEATGAHGCQNR